MKSRICPVCKTELLEQDQEILEGKKVHKGMCAQVLVEMLTTHKDDSLLNEQKLNNELEQIQLL